jgi:hypothetical protein
MEGSSSPFPPEAAPNSAPGFPAKRRRDDEEGADDVSTSADGVPADEPSAAAATDAGPAPKKRFGEMFLV